MCELADFVMELSALRDLAVIFKRPTGIPPGPHVNSKPRELSVGRRATPVTCLSTVMASPSGVLPTSTKRTVNSATLKKDTG